MLAGVKNIISANTIFGGFSNAACWRMMLDNNTRVFVKGSHPADPSHGAANIRGEVAAGINNPFIGTHAPALLGLVSHDRGDDNGWWLGVWRDVGTPTREITANEALLWLEQLADAPSVGVRDYLENPYLKGFFDNSRKWQQLQTQATARQRFENTFADGAPWLERHLPKLILLTQEFATQKFDCGLMHGDLRADNFLVCADKTYVVDWANAANGPLVFDAVFLSAALVMRGQLSVEEACRVLAGHDDAEGMTVSMAGYFADQAGRAFVPAMPRLRVMQTGMLVALLHMLAVFGIIDSPPALAATAGPDSPST